MEVRGVKKEKLDELPSKNEKKAIVNQTILKVLEQAFGKPQ